MEFESSVEIENLSKSKAAYVIGVDVGGTNTRVSIGTLDGAFFPFTKFKASTLGELISGLKIAGVKLRETLAQPAASCIDIAGPISDQGGKAEITNYIGSTAERIITKADLPESIFPHASTLFINDLEACCFGILALAKVGTLNKYFAPLWGGEGSGKIEFHPSHYAVLAAGTGLGAGLLTKLPGRNFQVLPLEGGHGLIPASGKATPYYEREKQLFEFLSQKLYEGKYGPEYEDIVSGRGVSYVYEWLTSGSSDPKLKSLSTEDIARAANNKSIPEAEDALLLHYRYLIRCAQGICVTMNGKGVFLAGDNQVYNLPFVKANSHVFQEEFLHHPKRQWLEHTPVYVQTELYNFNLHGTVYVADLIAHHTN
eukprot:TRINITY_DN4108_c0_g2_i1.p1 TRINITY_DN4108_c0_g2~~TRINITY_DN4108_c0_g2_i1.p1  ORF type:complete len:370 (+),score=78.68 TRINITY_DN4108_c0_g2_i1:123-1232(+)